jgi:hypothetical protein
LSYKQWKEREREREKEREREREREKGRKRENSLRVLPEGKLLLLLRGACGTDLLQYKSYTNFAAGLKLYSLPSNSRRRRVARTNDRAA